MKLPGWHKDVAPPLEVYGPELRSASTYVKALLQLEVFDHRYTKNELGTFCNYLVHDALMVLGVPLPRVNSWPMLANNMVDYLGKHKDWTKVVWQDAVTNALLGCPTVYGKKAKEHGHVGMVLPANASTAGNILTMQAGNQNWYGRELAKAFGNNVNGVEFFIHI